MRPLMTDGGRRDAEPEEPEGNVAVVRETVDLAYELAVNSLANSHLRVDAIEKRIDSIAAIGSGATVAAITLASGQKLAFESGWFASAMIGALAAMALAAGTRVAWKSKGLNMESIESDLGSSAVQFKANIIRTAAEAHACNRALRRRLTMAGRWILAAYAAEAICLCLWAYRA